SFMSTINLDVPTVYQKYDPDNMLARIHELPSQCEQAWQEISKFKLPSDYVKVDKIVILGMGGSAIGGDLAASLAFSESRVPVTVNRDYHLPAYVDKKTLVIASSYSGNTEETLTAFKEARKAGAKLLAATTSGELKSIVEKEKIPAFIFGYKAQPRAALGYSLLPMLGFLQKLGFVKDKSADVAEMLRVMRSLAGRINENVPSAGNPAKQLADDLHGKLSVIYGSGILSDVARRWKTQINENSKGFAFYEVLPELNHNAVVGYQYPAELKKAIKVIMLRSPLLEPRVLLRYQITGELLAKAGVAYQYIEGEGSSALSQMMSLVLFGDYVSYYLAILYEIDPSPVAVISYLKDRLAKG
ncbi:MAG: bifunctional phosphoglucose/phosphomannose isomerase, partial [Dehalococcoidales bacterium]|nr:bifunctional phosphoglucose/phosphomannose isomerase [Dehalococcoidales bacterium]